MVGQFVREILNEKYAAQIRELVTKHIEEKVTAAMMENVTDTAVAKLARAAEERY